MSNNPNLKPVEMTADQSGVYAAMQQRETRLVYLDKTYPDSDSGWHDRLVDHRVAMEAFLDDLGITDY